MFIGKDSWEKINNVTQNGNLKINPRFGDGILRDSQVGWNYLVWDSFSQPR